MALITIGRAIDRALMTLLVAALLATLQLTLMAAGQARASTAYALPSLPKFPPARAASDSFTSSSLTGSQPLDGAMSRPG